MSVVLELRAAHGGIDGAPASTPTVTAIRMKTADNDTVDTNNPLSRPTSGVNHSYEKWIQLFATTPPDNLVNNFRFHRHSGTPSTGITDYYGERSQSEDYEVPVGTDSAYATSAVPTVATALSKDATDFSNDDEQYGPWLVLQWDVGTTASAGSQTPVTYRWTVDEV